MVIGYAVLVRSTLFRKTAFLANIHGQISTKRELTAGYYMFNFKLLTVDYGIHLFPRFLLLRKVNCRCGGVGSEYLCNNYTEACRERNEIQHTKDICILKTSYVILMVRKNDE